MGPYRQVMTSFWTDSFVSDHFSAEDKYFYLYSLTNIHTNLCGCYDISFKQMASETGMNVDTISAIVNRFVKVYNLVRYDESTREFLILNWGKHNWTESPKFRKYLRKEIESIKNNEFRAFLTDELEGKDDFEYHIKSPDTLSRVEDTFDGYVIDNSNSNSSNLEEDNNLKEVSNEEVKKKVRNKYEDTPEFAEFWNAYPKHQGKTIARAAFEKVDVPLQVLLDAIEVQKRSRQWMKDGGDFIPMPSTWLNQKRWEDSMDVNIPRTDGMERYSNLQRLAEEFDGE